ncbi:hypothetical protein [Deinococcus sedimenti]|uniref:Uncharacterized protein n=1 Tax=Deinococcus sedimenti TaxID=1867090 RepID=A0ABQ2SAB7_9DEIO|nr:hypothetical protein [Deinococcus sedimenti]GGS10443.1 hypothetical protein GCM10008960_40680 [Deinococcus sedimenti]
MFRPVTRFLLALALAFSAARGAAEDVGHLPPLLTATVCTGETPAATDDDT